MREKGNILLIVVIVAGFLAVIGFMVLRGNISNTSDSGILPSDKLPVTTVTQGPASETDSRYMEYSSGILENYSDQNRILYFHANWCPTCRPLDAALTANSSRIPEGYVIIRINYNDSETDADEEDLAAKYGITYQHTFVQLDANGNEVSKWNGGQIEELLNRLK